MAMATALVVISTFFIDAIDHAMLAAFGLERREDVQLTLARPRATSTLTELEHLPGVLHAEPFRVVPVRFRNGPRTRNAAITAMPTTVTLQQVLDVDLQTIPIPAEGLVLSRKLAEILDARVGETLGFEVLEGHRQSHRVQVARIAETYVGLSAFMSLQALCRVLREPPTLNGAWLQVDDDLLPELHRAVKRTPVIAGISSRSDAMRSYRKLIDENLGTTITINIAMALIMALGILYNAARITLAEQAHQLASLRVLGFRRREVAAILLGELGFLTALAIPVGMWLGHGLASVIVEGLNSEQLRIPLVIAPRTYAIAGVTVLIAAILSGFAAWRRLDRMDIIEVLKTRE
jgi:putative ABC transport system permease protein